MPRSPHLRQHIRFVTFATAWGPALGGVNSFNRDFAVALAKALECRIACVVPGASDADVQDAREGGVALLRIGSKPQEEFDVASASLVTKLEDFSQVEYWIGHDILTGEFASKVRAAAQRGRLALIMHQSYDDYAAVKHVLKDASANGRRQRELFSKADEVFAVGPLLAERLKDMTRRGKVIIPGLRVLPNIPAENSLKVVVFGRLTPENVLIKGIALAGHAVAEAVKTAINARSSKNAAATQIKFIGADPSEATARQIKESIEKRAGRCLNVTVRPFLPMKELQSEIEGSNLCLMLSWHEGFGLAAWEAIGAGIPIIISTNSGVFRLLDDVGGHACGCIRALNISGSFDAKEPFQKEDLKAASEAVLDVLQNTKKAIKNADHLRRMLLDRGYTWESAGREFVSALGHRALLRAVPPGVPHIAKVRRDRKLTSRRTHRKAGEDVRIQQAAFSVQEMVTTAGLTGFYPSRDYYGIYRIERGIDQYISTAQKSIVMVSVNLVTGFQYDGIADVLQQKLETISDFSVLISLLDPSKKHLMQTMAPALDKTPEALESSIRESLERLGKLRSGLSAPAQSRFAIRVHQSIPFGSAILLDHKEVDGRIQIETKVYKVPMRKSFAFEVRPSGGSGFYKTLISGYLNLIEDGEETSQEVLGMVSTSTVTG